MNLPNVCGNEHVASTPMAREPRRVELAGHARAVVAPGATLTLLGLALVIWLLPGPRHLSDGVVIDLHTMVFGVIFTLMGAQLIAIGFFAKAFIQQ